EQHLWRYEKKLNGVRIFRLPRRYFNSQGWRNTVRSAQYGVSPIGGKSVFPIDWGTKDILHAIKTVLDNPETFVLRLKSNKASPNFYLRSLVGKIHVEVGIEGGNVNTAFPSWRQDRPDTIGNAYREWYNDESRLRDGLDYGSFRNDCDFLKKIQFPNEFI